MRRTRDPPATCANCGEEFTPRIRTQVYCSRSCYHLGHLERVKANARRSAKARDFIHRTDPLVARALALTMWPELRTPEEQAALDAWLEDRIARGIAEWARTADQ